MGVCTDMCLCNEGFARTAYGSCIPEGECKSINSCGPNEYRDKCGSPCKEANCNDDPNNPTFCTRVCTDMCLCKEGFARNENGECVPDGECIIVIECGPNEHRDICGSACKEANCNDDPNNPMFCTRMCTDMCLCNEGFARNENGECIPDGECVIVNQCGPNEHRDVCGSPCKEANCNDDPNNPMFCTRMCTDMCLCNEGFARNQNGECVPDGECTTVKKCGPNEYRDECGNPCKESNCNDDPKYPRICAECE